MFLYDRSCDVFFFFFSSRRRHTRCALVTGVQTCALPICTLHPNSPGSFYLTEQIRIGIDHPGLTIQVTAMQADADLPFQCNKILLHDAIKIHQFLISVVYHLDLGGFFREKNCRAADKRLTVKDMRGQRSEEHTSELQSLMRISYAVCC